MSTVLVVEWVEFNGSDYDSIHQIMFCIKESLLSPIVKKNKIEIYKKKIKNIFIILLIYFINIISLLLRKSKIIFWHHVTPIWHSDVSHGSHQRKRENVFVFVIYGKVISLTYVYIVTTYAYMLTT